MFNTKKIINNMLGGNVICKDNNSKNKDTNNDKFKTLKTGRKGLSLKHDLEKNEYVIFKYNVPLFEGVDNKQDALRIYSWQLDAETR